MKKGLWIVKFLIAGTLMLAAVGFATMLLWNWLVPTLFTGPVITFWQALGLLALSKILFWSFGGRRSSSPNWKPYLKAKWNTMTPEDRERFKQKMKEKWCGWENVSSEKKSSDISNV